MCNVKSVAFPTLLVPRNGSPVVKLVSLSIFYLLVREQGCKFTFPISILLANEFIAIHFSEGTAFQFRVLQSNSTGVLFLFSESYF